MFEITLNGVKIKRRRRPKHLARLPQGVADEMELNGYRQLKKHKCAVALCKTQVSPLIRKWVEVFRPEEVKEELYSAGHRHSMPFTIWLFPKEGMDSDPMIFPPKCNSSRLCRTAFGDSRRTLKYYKTQGIDSDIAGKFSPQKTLNYG